MSRDLNSADEADVKAVVERLEHDDLSRVNPGILLEFFNRMLDQILD